MYKIMLADDEGIVIDSLKFIIEKEFGRTLSPIEYEIIKLMTVEHVLKEKSKIEETYGGWSDKYIFELLNRSFTEFWSDNWQYIFKKFKSLF